MNLRHVPKMWEGRTVVVAATGPSLTRAVAEACRLPWVRTIAVNDAHKLLPWAELLYACDAPWWTLHDGVPAFRGQRWTTHDDGANDKRAIAGRYGLHIVAGRRGETFSRDPAVIHYGNNSGFQAINLAVLTGARRIVLVGFDMRVVDDRRHFFGHHPKPLRNGLDYRALVPIFRTAARTAPELDIVVATPDSALTCWPRMTIDQALASEMQAA